MQKEKTKTVANPVGANCVRLYLEEITKKQKGITLVALVITIAIMLILAGVTINISLKGGLFSRANEATAQMQIEAEKEELLTAALGTLGRNGKVNLGELDNNLPEGFTGSNGQYTSSTGNRYQVTEDADIILLDGTEEEEEETVATITLSATQISKEITNGVSETVELTATLNNASGDLTWTSSDTSVAEISESGTTGIITLKKAGTAIITVKYGTQATATCNITVTEKQATLISFTIGGTEYTATEGQTWKDWIIENEMKNEFYLYYYLENNIEITSNMSITNFVGAPLKDSSGNAVYYFDSIVADDYYFDYSGFH